MCSYYGILWKKIKTSDQGFIVIVVLGFFFFFNICLLLALLLTRFFVREGFTQFLLRLGLLLCSRLLADEGSGSSSNVYLYPSNFTIFSLPPLVLLLLGYNYHVWTFMSRCAVLCLIFKSICGSGDIIVFNFISFVFVFSLYTYFW